MIFDVKPASERSPHHAALVALRERCHFTLIAAISADGFIAARNHHNPEYSQGDFSSLEDRTQMRRVIKEESDCCVIGRVTYEIYGARLAPYKCIVLSRNSEISLFSDNHQQLAMGSDPSELLRFVGPFSSGDSKSRVLILGGAEIYTWFLEAKLVDRALITVEQGVELKEGTRLHHLSRDPFMSAQGESQVLAPGTILTEFKFS